jgi:SAM-dependent methyltransferase
LSRDQGIVARVSGAIHRAGIGLALRGRDLLFRIRLLLHITRPEVIAHPLFKLPLVDLIEENEAFAGVLTPQPEFGKPREGVDSVFLGNAEGYYKKYESFDYWRPLLRDATSRVGITDASLIVEFGCGFGNSTLPLLDLFPRAQILASDISPNLLVILNRLLASRALSSRCMVVAMDAQKDYIVGGCADLVVGSAILHHLVNPGMFIKRALDLLRPGGAAIFFEPLEGGNAIVRACCLEIVREASRRGEKGPTIDFARNMGAELEPQIFRDMVPGWENKNDKWAFPRSVLDRLASDAGARLTIYPLHDTNEQFRRHFIYALRTYGGFEEKALPQWAWEIFSRYDRETFSPEMLTDLAISGCVIFRKDAVGENQLTSHSGSS